MRTPGWSVSNRFPISLANGATVLEPVSTSWFWAMSPDGEHEQSANEVAATMISTDIRRDTSGKPLSTKWFKVLVSSRFLLSSLAPRKKRETQFSRSKRRHLFSARCSATSGIGVEVTEVTSNSADPYTPSLKKVPINTVLQKKPRFTALPRADFKTACSRERSRVLCGTFRAITGATPR
jgi:hypothetical protein